MLNTITKVFVCLHLERAALSCFSFDMKFSYDTYALFRLLNLISLGSFLGLLSNFSRKNRLSGENQVFLKNDIIFN